MTEAAIQTTIFDVLRTIAPDADPRSARPDENLREALEIDSFDFLNLLIGLHKKLGVEIPESDYGKLNSLAGLTRYLQEKSGESINS
jgi:acyl carrier protein